MELCSVLFVTDGVRFRHRSLVADGSLLQYYIVMTSTATLEKHAILSHANSIGSDQPALLCRLLMAFTVGRYIRLCILFP